jgi:hypothetical protein
MPYGNKIRTSLHGRRIGLQRMSSSESGGSLPNREFLVGPEDLRLDVTTAETTSANLKAFGVSNVAASSAGSSSVYTLDPPVPGVRKIITGGTSGPVYVKTANGETIMSSAGSSFTTIKISSAGGSFELMGFTTAQWLSYFSTASGIGLSTTT